MKSLARLHRRNFLLLTAGTTLRAKPSDRLETLRDWFGADKDTRRRGLEQTLALIKREDASVQAWVQVSPQMPTGEGKLSDIPFGAKDIIETKGLSTAYGSPAYAGRIGVSDADIVKNLRHHGAILLGKTQTAAFAIRDPPPTRNPRNLAHTPGGSSSGSAAAVAAGMVPLALGTQTGGSTIRPASYCGITGFKPTYELFSLDGVLPYSKSCDTLGFFTHSPKDMFILWGALDQPSVADETFPMGFPSPMPSVEPEMKEALERAYVALNAAGVSLRPVNISGMISKLFDAHRVVSYYEGARFHQKRLNEFGTKLGDGLVNMVREGLQISEAQYGKAQAFVSECQARLSDLYSTTPVILFPAATGPAPLGISFTGNAKMNSSWTAVGTPAITIPMPHAKGLPLGLQLTADRGRDARLLRAAIGVERALDRYFAGRQ
jgi:Asp-tRNA(Asn)/Glu-tRNA(Gln) amidotransferase A subunit family amidase